MRVPSVYIVGAGLSGLALAEFLSRPERVGPCRIVLLEGRPAPGGRVSSYRESFTGDWEDNGQHLFMDVYRSMLSFLERIGTRNRVHFPSPFSIDLLDDQNRVCPFRLDPKRGALGGLTGILGFSGLSLGSRLSMLKVGHRLSSPKLTEASVDHLDARTLLEMSGATKESIDRFWELLVISATNLSASDVSAALLVRILRETLLGGHGPSLIGWSTVSHRELIVDPALSVLSRRGVSVRCKSPVSRISLSENQVTSIRAGDETIDLSSGDHLVLAVPPWSLEKILPIEIMEGPLAQNIMRIGFSSGIVSIHLWFKEEIRVPPIGGLMSGPVHWIFNKDAMKQENGKGTLTEEGEGGTLFMFSEEESTGVSGAHLSLTVSGISSKDETSEEEWLSRALVAVGRFAGGRLLPDLLHHRVIREKMSTPILGPGQALIRPSNRTEIPNLWLCGDATDTGLPATMEGAVRSAYALAGMLVPLIQKPVAS